VAHKNYLSNWQKIAQEFGGNRSAYQIFIHFQAESNKVRNNWTLSEDNAVRTAIGKLKMGNYIPFSAVADQVPGRNSRQVAQRWRCHLDPSIYRGGFTKREDILLVICRFMKNMTYREISERYIMRSENQLRLRYHALKSSTTFENL